jgi:hypothetical protein
MDRGREHGCKSRVACSRTARDGGCAGYPSIRYCSWCHIEPLCPSADVPTQRVGTHDGTGQERVPRFNDRAKFCMPGGRSLSSGAGSRCTRAGGLSPRFARTTSWRFPVPGAPAATAPTRACSDSAVLRHPQSKPRPSRGDLRCRWRVKDTACAYPSPLRTVSPPTPEYVTMVACRCRGSDWAWQGKPLLHGLVHVRD